MRGNFDFAASHKLAGSGHAVFGPARGNLGARLLRGMFRERAFDWAIIAAISVHALSIAVLGLYRREYVTRSLEPAVRADAAELSVELAPIEDTMIRAPIQTVDTALTSARRASSNRHDRSITALTRGTTSARVAVQAPNATGALPNDDLRYVGVAAPDKTNSSDHEVAVNSTEGDSAFPSNASQRAERRTLSPSELGLVPGNYAAVMPMESPVRTAMQTRLASSRRLERSMRQGAAEHSGQLGIGEEGPILAKLEQLVQRSSIGSYDKTSIAVRVLPSGVVQLDLIGTTTDRAAWNRLLAQAERELSSRVKLPKGSKGLELELLFESRVQLPSGTDPGVAVNLFGLPLAKGEGPRSNRIDILSSLPKLKIGDSAAVRNDPCSQQRLEVDVVTSKFDLADLSGKRTRMVHARVVRRTVL